MPPRNGSCVAQSPGSTIAKITFSSQDLTWISGIGPECRVPILINGGTMDALRL